MFTGIIQYVGNIKSLDRAGKLLKLTVSSKLSADGIKTGDSVSINGVCLTLTDKRGGILCFDIMAQTVSNTNLASLKVSDKVNMELALKTGDFLGGHLVLGHADTVGRIAGIASSGDGYYLDISFPREFSHLIVDKGSVAVDGVSLTVGRRDSEKFRVYIIPLTLRETTLNYKSVGDSVNLEFDIIGKYVESVLRKTGNKGAGITENFLRNNGF